VTDELVAWLRARLDEDEQAARAARDDVSHAADPRGEWRWRGTHDALYARHIEVAVGPHGPLGEGLAEHIARWDPVRVLAEVAAKRRTIDDYTEARTSSQTEPNPAAQHEWEVIARVLELQVRRFASVYAGRPGWRSEWAPDEENSRG
jgi:hypothetical protein